MSSLICNPCMKELKQESYRFNRNYDDLLEYEDSRLNKGNEFKRTYNNSFIYLTYLFRNGKILLNNNSKSINKNNNKKEKIQIKEITEIKKRKKENILYNNRTDPHKEATQLYDYLQKNKKKFASNEQFHKTFSGFEKLLQNNENKEELKKIKKTNLQSYYSNYVREGFFGRKNKDNIPRTFPSVSLYKNSYATKSEKERHEKLLDEFAKLSYFLDNDSENKLQIIKDFLIKYHIVDLNNYSNEQLLQLEKLISNKNLIIKPYKDIKSIIREILNKGLYNQNNLITSYKHNFYISPNIPKRKIRIPQSPPKKINIYETMDLERQKKFFLQNIDFSDYNKIYNKIQNEIVNLTENHSNNLTLGNEKNDFKFITKLKIKPNTLLTSEKSTMRKTLNSSSRVNKTTIKYSIDEITQRLYYKPIWKPFGINDIEKNKKITEFAAYSKARNILFENKLKKSLEE